MLGSKSPRRSELLRLAGIPFELRCGDVEEIYPETLPLKEVPEYLARLKAEPLLSGLAPDELLLTADTIVLLEGEIIGKPIDAEDADRMLHRLSGKTHEVISGVCLSNSSGSHSFSCLTKVHFRELRDEWITAYIRECNPLDKAGSYAIQEWIGLAGIERIEGDYSNVVGLPVQALIRALSQFGTPPSAHKPA